MFERLVCEALCVIPLAVPVPLLNVIPLAVPLRSFVTCAPIGCSLASNLVLSSMMRQQTFLGNLLKQLEGRETEVSYYDCASLFELCRLKIMHKYCFMQASESEVDVKKVKRITIVYYRIKGEPKRSKSQYKKITQLEIQHYLNIGIIRPY